MKPRLTPEVAALADSYRAVLEEYLREQARAASEPVSWPALSASAPAVVNHALRQLQVLDKRRQRLWNPAPNPTPARTARTGAGESSREKAAPLKRK